MSTSQLTRRGSRRPLALSCTIALGLLSVAIVPLGAARPAAAAAVDHLVISEVVTGGVSASDELIELYNPTSALLPLEGLELVYVSASGATTSLRAAWSLGAPGVAPGAHVLVSNELGVYAAIADTVYASGMAATGGSVALRIQGAASAVDAVGWGTATSSWLEGSPAPAAPIGASLERRPGGAAGSTVDTDDNAADFAVRAVPDPQNAASPPVPQAAATPSPFATPMPTATVPPPSASPGPTGSPDPAPITVAAARDLADGSAATIEATALTGSDFTDGGGYLADATAGIAVLLESGSFARGDLVRVSGILDDRFAQRTLRATGIEMAAPGGGPPAALARATGAIDESVEGRLVRIEGAVDGSPTALTGGVAFDVDDGSGPARVVVGSATGIDTADWSDGRRIVVTGLAGQRDSSGTGASGYRVQPRDAADVELLPATSPAPSASSSPGAATPAPSAPAELSTIARARAAAIGARLRVRGVVTLASGTVEDGSAVIQDATGAILLRLGDEVGELNLGRLVEADGVRSTKGGMETLRVSEPPVDLGTTAAPAALQLRTGEAGEANEAQLVVVRGALVASARRASTGSISFDMDDGSGPLRVALGAPLAADDAALERGAWVEVSGVLGQQTTGAEPLAGYRVWPPRAGDVRVLTPATDIADTASDRGEVPAPAGGGATAEGGATVSLDVIGTMPLGDLRVGATLVAGRWEGAGLAGLLWDGRVLVAIAAASTDLLERAIGDRRPPISLELGHLAAVGADRRFGVAVVALGPDVGDVVVGVAPPSPPLARVPGVDDGVAWVSLVGRLSGDLLSVAGGRVAVERLCGNDRGPRRGAVSVTGVALANPPRLVVPCDGVRPVPRLALAMAATRDDAGPAEQAPAGTAAAVGPTAPRDRAAAGAALLGIGVGLLLIVALARWRIGPSDPAADGSAPDGEVEAPDGEPRLTLVSVPREHG